jgi:sialate O-acetylesterase
MKNAAMFAMMMALILTSFGCTQQAEVKLPSVIGDNMVMQWGGKVNLWGWAKPGESLTIQGDWQKQATTVVAGNDGKWTAAIDSPRPGGPYTITFKGRNTVTLKNVLCGEVWVCSGQSNMAYTLGNNGASWSPGVPGWEKDVAEANSLPEIRLFEVPYNPQKTPQTNVDARWTVATGENARKFSAVGYLFAKRLNKELKSPVGMIGSYYGASNAQTWMNHAVLDADPQFRADALSFEEKAMPEYEKSVADYQVKLKEYEAAAAKAKAEGQPAPKAPARPRDPRNKMPAGLYNGMIAPVIPFTIRGAIWYQGESNPDAAMYLRLMQALIADWRSEWNEPQMPFYFVQLAPYEKCNPAIREAQLQTMLTVPNTGMAVITDAGHKTNVHPHDKATVAERLASWALAKTYNRSDVVCSGPIYKGMKKEGSAIRIWFDYVGGGLVARGGDLTEFTIAGADGKFVPAKAAIEGDAVVVSAADVNEPENVRFAWGKWIQPNLYNREGLPASPFRTDSGK